MRVVLDSNIIVASFASRGLCKDVFELCLSECEIVTSKPLIEETIRALRNKIKVPSFLVDRIHDLLVSEFEVITALKIPHNSCRDPQDNEVLGVAVAGKADVIITGDEDLLVLKKFHTIPSLSPRAFWDFIKKESR